MILHQPLWFRDLAAYSLQVAILVITGGLLLRLFNLSVPNLRLAYQQALLAACLILPGIQPWRPTLAPAEGWAALSRISIAAQPVSPLRWPWGEIALAILAGGILLRLLSTALGLVRLRRHRQRAHPVSPETAPLLDAQSLAAVRPAVYRSTEIVSPATFGVLSPAVLFPQRFFDLPAAQQKAIACHEFLHVARRDWAWNLTEELILTLLWFHPAVWWIVKSIRLSREQTVDKEVIRLTSSRHAYLGALLAMSQQKIESVPAPLFLTESHLVQRVALIVKEVKMSQSRLIASLLAAVTILFLAGGAAVRSFPLNAPAVASSAGRPSSGGLPGTAGGFQNNGSPTGGKLYKIGKDVTPPRAIHDPEPAYTPQASKAHLMGTAVFSVVVDAKGNVHDVREVSKPLGLGLDESAIKTLPTWRFKPALHKGMPVPVRVNIQVTFWMH
jgi:TonB family protein